MTIKKAIEPTFDHPYGTPEFYYGFTPAAAYSMIWLYKNPFKKDTSLRVPVSWPGVRTPDTEEFKKLCDLRLAEEVRSYRFVLTNAGQCVTFGLVMGEAARRDISKWYIDEQYVEGMDARKGNTPIHYCPYEVDGPLRHSWLWGWLEIDRNARSRAQGVQHGNEYTLYEHGDA